MPQQQIPGGLKDCHSVYVGKAKKLSPGASERVCSNNSGFGSGGSHREDERAKGVKRKGEKQEAFVSFNLGCLVDCSTHIQGGSSHIV